MSEIYCANCKYYDNKGHCAKSGGLLHGIRISDAMAEAEHDCTKFKEALYVLTEAAHLDNALRNEGVELDFKQVKRICDNFFKGMMDAGMLTKGGEQ